MTCDNCGDSCNQATIGAGTGDQYWCDRCCLAAGIKVMRGAVESSYKNEIRERWEAEQKARRLAKLDAFLASRGKTRQTAREASKTATPEDNDMSKERTFKPCKQGKHEECTGSYWEDEVLGIAAKCKCDCHHPLAQASMFAAPKVESKQKALF